MRESLIYHGVRIFGWVMRHLPLWAALFAGRVVGMLAYYFDVKHKTIAHANLKMAFADTKSPGEIKRITKELFQNYGQNFIDLFRMPLMTPERFKKMIAVDGIEHLAACLKEGHGAIMLAMHFGSWELASLSCAMLGLPYKVMVKSQTRYSRLEELLNNYRSCSGYVVLWRGMGTRDFVRSLRNNEVIGMVVDQGGKDGVLVPFFGRSASMSVGAVRMALKWSVPICFSVIHREGDGCHRMVVHEKLDVINTGNMEADIVANLKKVTKVMETYIHKFPAEYMWFYKIWKYSNETMITILDDGKTGHLRQSESVVRALQKALKEREIHSSVRTVEVRFKSAGARRLFTALGLCVPPFVYPGRLAFLRFFLTPESYEQITRVKTDYVVSCGSAAAGVNNFLAKDHAAKSIAVLKPGLLPYERFDLLILPQHEEPRTKPRRALVAVTCAAPNLITREYQEKQKELLLNRYSHLKDRLRLKIGLLIGGNSRHVHLSENQVKALIHQLTEVAENIKADILVTTSRRTPPAIEQLIFKRLKKHPSCPLLISANQENIPEAVGGILGLCDILIVSGDSISMISEAASSGKNTIVFTPAGYQPLPGTNKHLKFIEQLNAQGYILSADVKGVGRAIYDIAKNKIQTRPLDDNETILKAVRQVI